VGDPNVISWRKNAGWHYPGGDPGAVIYVLRGPAFSAKWRYVGHTKKDPPWRLSKHMAHAFDRGVTNYNMKVAPLVRRIVNAGHIPQMRVIEICQTWRAEEREEHWIAEYRAAGWPLLNENLKGKPHPSYPLLGPSHLGEVFKIGPQGDFFGVEI